MCQPPFSRKPDVMDSCSVCKMHTSETPEAILLAKPKQGWAIYRMWMLTAKMKENIFKMLLVISLRA